MQLRKYMNIEKKQV